MTPARFSVLFVSTGNVCRSPIAERIMRAQLAAELGPGARWFSCESAGTWGHVGAAMEPHAIEVLRERSADFSAFVARELGADQVLAADLILGAAREHREQVRLLDPHALGRTFSLREFTRFARQVDGSTLPSGDAASRARALVEQVTLLRGPRPGPGRPEDDIPDPFGAPLHVFRLCADAIADGLAGLVGQLRPAAASGRQRHSTA